MSPHEKLQAQISLVISCFEQKNILFKSKSMANRNCSKAMFMNAQNTTEACLSHLKASFLVLSDQTVTFD